MLCALPGLAWPWSALSLCSRIPPCVFRVVATAWETTVSFHPLLLLKTTASASCGEGQQGCLSPGAAQRPWFGCWHSDRDGNRRQAVPNTACPPWSLICSCQGPLSVWGSGRDLQLNRSMWTRALACTNGSEIWHLRRAVSDGKCLMFALERIWGQADCGSSYITSTELTLLQHLFTPSSKPCC